MVMKSARSAGPTRQARGDQSASDGDGSKDAPIPVKETGEGLREEGAVGPSCGTGERTEGWRGRERENAGEAGKKPERGPFPSTDATASAKDLSASSLSTGLD